MIIRKGDMVVVKVGDDASGGPRKVLRLVGTDKVVVEGVNRVYRHVKKGHPKSPQGGRLSVEKSVHKSNVAMWCEHCKMGKRTTVLFASNGRRSRGCVGCQKEI